MTTALTLLHLRLTISGNTFSGSAASDSIFFGHEARYVSYTGNVCNDAL